MCKAYTRNKSNTMINVEFRDDFKIALNTMYKIY